ncbi:MAG TPA: hypothetical protein VGF74_13315 [Thermoleophilaceae bacterium]|jgi:hypothetical protein
MRGVARIALLAVAVMLLAAAPAGAVIRPQKGMAGVRLGMSQTQMRDVLGEPSMAKQGDNDFGPFTQFIYPHSITVTFQGNRHVTGISTRGRTEKTERGVGVGSTEAAVKAKVGHVRCETISGKPTCHVGSFAAGHRVTVFLISKTGNVSTITVGFVLD